MRLRLLGAAAMVNHRPVIRLWIGLRSLGPRGSVGDCAPGGRMFRAAALVDGVGGSSSAPGAVKGPWVNLISRRSWTTRKLMVLGVASKFGGRGLEYWKKERRELKFGVE